MLYVSNIRLENIRCFDNETLSFINHNSRNDIIPWTIVLGDNGTGKSTILRCIAMALSGETSASGLLRELSGELIRKGKESGVIEVTLCNYDGSNEKTSKTTLCRTPRNEEELEQWSDANSKDDIFLCGYGANRRSIGTPPPDKYSPLEAVFTLFNYESAQLLAPETIIYRILRKGYEEEQLLNDIASFLMLPKGSIRLGDSGIEIKGPWGDYVGLGGLGDGYSAIFALIVDILGWIMFFRGGEPIPGNEVTGVVLIDEIDQHLHPEWQKRIVRLLRDGFPNVQFIVSTHAPLVAIGAAELKEDDCQLALCEMINTEVRIRSAISPPRASRADQVLTSYLFGLRSTSSGTLKSAIDNFADLKRKKTLSAKDKQDLKYLRTYLNESLGPESSTEGIVRHALDTVLDDLLKQGIHQYDKEDIKYELRRQINEILGGKL